MAVLYYGEVESPAGPLTVLVSGNGVCRVEFGTNGEKLLSLQRWLGRFFPDHDLIHSDERITNAREQLQEYFGGGRFSFDLALDLQGTPFQKQVWQALQQIPYGETRSYKDIAEAIGSPKAVRAVGGANNKNPVSLIVPCHRVIGAGGSLVGYGGGIERKKYLLDFEKENNNNRSPETASV